MKITLFTFLATSALPSLISAIPFNSNSPPSTFSPRTFCDNTATSRDCWGEYSIDTDWYSTIPRTGITREYWLSVENTTLAPDGYQRQTLTFNGTVPGPAIIADWGDNLVIHVTNNLEHNGTAIHWHGIRQLRSVEYDGVPGVTQCPIAPGDTLTYRFQATQYGTTWYHSHFSLQYGDGLLGPLIINGPATANYDEDLGAMFLSDWAHESVFKLWGYKARTGGTPVLENTLINGTNTFDCTDSTDANCIGNGTKYETTFVSGKKYRIRLINTALDAHFHFSIDNHTLTVISTDLVPIVPYETSSLSISIGQRYDIIVEANADVGDYWIRGGWVSACSTNANPTDMTGIIRYNSTSTADPTSTGVAASTYCGDEDVSNLVPHLALNVGNFTTADVTLEDLYLAFGSAFTWTLNSSSLYLNWSDPTMLKIFHNESIFPTDYNVIPLETSITDEWAVLVIQDDVNIGLYHPMHLHGHDFWILAQDVATYERGVSESTWNLVNPPRRDVASLPGNGYLAIAFKKDNPGSWLLHCHIAWHASQGLSMQFVESESNITLSRTNMRVFEETCTNWDTYTPTEVYLQDDSGI